MATPVTKREPVSRDEMLRRAAELVPVLRERAARAEQLRQIPPETVHDLRASELIRIGNPERYGGHGVEVDAAYDVGWELGRSCGSTGWCYSLWTIHNWWAGHFSKQAQDELFAGGTDTLSGFHVLADKPWLVEPDDLDDVRASLAGWPLVMEIRTGRHDVAAGLFKRLVDASSVFGTFRAIEPALEFDGVHYLGLDPGHESHFTRVRDELLRMIDGGDWPATLAARTLAKYTLLAEAAARTNPADVRPVEEPR